MNTVADVLKAKCDELTAAIKKESDFVSSTNGALKQLRAERRLALARIQEFNGGLMAYGSTLNLMNAGQAQTPAVDAAATVEEVQAVEGEIVPDSGAAVMD